MSDSETGVAQTNSHPDCEMPECVGSPDDETHIVKDPSGEPLTMCEGCLNDGWRAAVEVLD